MKTLYPNFENVSSEFMYVLDVMYVLRKLSASWTKLIEIDEICHFVGLNLNLANVPNLAHLVSANS